MRNDIYSLGVIGQQLLPESAYRGIWQRCQRSIERQRLEERQRQQEAALKAELELQLKARQQLEERQRQQDEAKQRYDAILQEGKRMIAKSIESLRQKKATGDYIKDGDWALPFQVEREYMQSVRPRLTEEEQANLEYALNLFLMEQNKLLEQQK